jgi:hypothetical protein
MASALVAGLGLVLWLLSRKITLRYDTPDGATAANEYGPPTLLSDSRTCVTV